MRTLTHVLYEDPRLFRFFLNAYPPYLGTGICIDEISPDWKRVVVRMKRRFYNGNAFGTHFGGSLYSMCDPHLALMLIPLLGKGEYIVWDKAAHIDFVKPGRGTVTAVFEWTDEEIDDIRAKTADGSKYEPVKTVLVRDEAGDIVAKVKKTIYVRRKQRNGAGT